MRKLNHTTLLFPLAAAFALSSPAAFAQSHGAGVNATAAVRVPAQLPAQASADMEMHAMQRAEPQQRVEPQKATPAIPATPSTSSSTERSKCATPPPTAARSAWSRSGPAPWSAKWPP